MYSQASMWLDIHNETNKFYLRFFNSGVVLGTNIANRSTICFTVMTFVFPKNENRAARTVMEIVAVL